MYVCVCWERSKQKDHFYRLSGHARGGKKVEKCINKPKGVGRKRERKGKRKSQRWLGVSSLLDPEAVLCVSAWSQFSPCLLSLCVADWCWGEEAGMWTPTDHWLEITIETLGRWEGWMAQGALQGENIYGKYLRLQPSWCPLSPLYFDKNIFNILL